MPNILACGNLKRYNRSLVSKLVCGILPLEVESGRYVKKEKRKEIQERNCTTCNKDQVEDEYQFMVKCKTLKAERKCFYAQHIPDVPAFKAKTNRDKLKYLLSKEFIKKTSMLVETLYCKLCSIMYKPNVWFLIQCSLVLTKQIIYIIYMLYPISWVTYLVHFMLSTLQQSSFSLGKGRSVCTYFPRKEE